MRRACRTKFALVAAVLFLAGMTIEALEPVPVPSARWKEAGAGLWRELELPFQVKVNAARVIDGVVYLCTDTHGLLIGRDQGRSWSRVDFGWVSLYSAARFNNDLLVGSQGSVALSPDGGRSWTVKAVTPPVDILSIAAGDKELVFGTSKGIYEFAGWGTPLRPSKGSPAAAAVMSVMKTRTGWWAFQNIMAPLLGSNNLKNGWRETNSVAGNRLFVPSDLSASGDSAVIAAGPATAYSTDGGLTWQAANIGADACFAFDSGRFLLSDDLNNVRHVVPGKPAASVPDLFPGSVASWYVNGRSVKSLLPAESLMPEADWDQEEVWAMLDSVNLEDVKLQQQAPASQRRVSGLCSDGVSVYAVTKEGRLYRYPLCVLTGDSPVIPDRETAIVKNLNAAWSPLDTAKMSTLSAELGALNDWNPHYLLARGYLALDQGKYQESVSYFSQQLRIGGSFEALYYRGIALQNLGRSLGAVLDFTTVIDQNARIAPWALYSRGVMFFYAGEPELARADLEDAVSGGVKDAQEFMDKYLK